jgi:hypothetical protein
VSSNTLAIVPASGIERVEFVGRMRALSLRTGGASPEESWAGFAALQAEFEGLGDAVRLGLLATPFAWTPELKAQMRWLNQANDTFAVLAFRLAETFATRLGIHDGRTLEMMARALFYMGETVKGEVAVNPRGAHDYRKAHALIRQAMACGHHRDPMHLRFDGRQAPCTLEGLYFRTLLIARFGSGTLNVKQIEVLDAWIWMWMPALLGVTAPPDGLALRADLDSNAPFRAGSRKNPGPSLYLPLACIERAYEALVAGFHAGRVAPAEGCTRGFEVEVHVGVLDMIRRAMRQANRTPTPRAARRKCDLTVGVLVGLPEIMAQGFSAAPADTPAVEQRFAELADKSGTGMGLEAEQADFGAVAPGDILVVSASGEEPASLGKVVRIAASSTHGRLAIGVRRLASQLRLVRVMRTRGDREVEEALIFVPGEDRSGRHDAYLVSESIFAEPGPMTICLAKTIFTFRFNRARDRGRDWVLAGFEVVAARPALEAA